MVAVEALKAKHEEELQQLRNEFSTDQQVEGGTCLYLWLNHLANGNILPLSSKLILRQGSLLTFDANSKRL